MDEPDFDPAADDELTSLTRGDLVRLVQATVADAMRDAMPAYQEMSVRVFGTSIRSEVARALAEHRIGTIG